MGKLCFLSLSFFDIEYKTFFNNQKFQSDGAQANYQTTTRESEQINPADEAKIKLPKKRDAEKNEKKLPEGAKGPKLTKKQVTRETNARNAAQFGNLTDYQENTENYTGLYCLYDLLQVHNKITCHCLTKQASYFCGFGSNNFQAYCKFFYQGHAPTVSLSSVEVFTKPYQNPK